MFESIETQDTRAKPTLTPATRLKLLKEFQGLASRESRSIDGKTHERHVIDLNEAAGSDNKRVIVSISRDTSGSYLKAQQILVIFDRSNFSEGRIYNDHFIINPDGSFVRAFRQRSGEYMNPRTDSQRVLEEELDLRLSEAVKFAKARTPTIRKP